MSKILVLGSSGSGKSTAIGNIPELGITGLDPTTTFIIACSGKGLPFRGWMESYTKEKVRLERNNIVELAGEGNYYPTTNGGHIANIITLIGTTRPDITTIVVDDLNYVMQDYYMEKGVKGGYDVFKQIGHFMGRIFNAMDTLDIREKNVIVNAHFEEFKASNSDAISFRFKTVGKMVSVTLSHYLFNCWNILRAVQTTIMEKSHYECLKIVQIGQSASKTLNELLYICMGKVQRLSPVVGEYILV